MSKSPLRGGQGRYVDELIDGAIIVAACTLLYVALMIVLGVLI